jgi:ribokinase
MNKQPRVCVIGSINMDMVTITDKVPAQGETVLGGTFETYPGGKGANQAIAAARLGAIVSLVGVIGEDPYGEMLLENFKSENVNVKTIKVNGNLQTGTASITLSGNDNRIIVSSGANSKLTPEVVSEFKEIIISSDIILLQFEVPMDTVKYTVDLCYQYNLPIVVNPAPYQEMPGTILTKATYFTPNEGEALSMMGTSLYESIKHKMIITKGSHGVEYFSSAGESKLIPAYQVPVKDTTGAGDAFNGAFATELAKGSPVDKAVTFANATAALSVGRLGAQAGLPSKEEVDEFLLKQKR